MDQALSGDHLVVLRIACEHRRHLHGSSKIEELSSITDLPNETIIEIAETVRNSYYKGGAEIFTLPKKVYLVIGWRQGQAFAVTPALGTVGEKQLFQLAPVIIETAKAKIEPQAQRESSRSERRGFSIASGVCIVLAILASIFGIEQRGVYATVFFVVIGLILASPLVLIPVFNRNDRKKTEHALGELYPA